MVTFRKAALLAVLMAVPAVQAGQEAKKSLFARAMRHPAVVAITTAFVTSPILKETLFSKNPSADNLGLRIANEYKRNIKNMWANLTSLVNSTKQTAASVEKALEDKAPQAKAEQISKDVQAKAEETQQVAKGMVLLAQHKVVKNWNKAVKKVTKWWNRE